MIMKTLLEIYNELPDKSDKGSVHSYLEVYESILAPYRETARNILEIGLFNGASLRMWEKYFTGKVHGVDCDIRPHGGMADLNPLLDEGTHNVYILNAESEFDCEMAFKGIKFDVIVEDAGHDLLQQIKIFNVLKNYWADDGIYIIEDVQSIQSARGIRSTLYEYDVTIFDRREIKGRYDDILIIIRK